MPTMVWKFVATPEANPTVLFDMNRAQGKVMLNFGSKFDISPPPKKRAFTTNSMTDGGLLTSSAYENRILEFTVTLQGSVAEKAALQAELIAQLSKDQNLIMYTPKPGVIPPVFFRTMSSDDFGFSIRREEGPWHIACKVLAEPFAIGTRIDHTTGAVVTNDPAAAVTNPAKLDLTGIIGNVPTPPVIRIVPGTVGQLKNNPIYIGQRTQREMFTNFKQAESGTMGANTSTWTAPSNASGSGANMTATTFATPSMTGRLTFQFADPNTSDAMRGRYRVLMRVGTGNEGSTYKMRWAIPAGNGYVRGRVTHMTLTSDVTKRRLVDLGLISHPLHAMPEKIGYANLAPGTEDIWLVIDAERVSGGNMDMDYVYLMPADERLCVVSGATTDAGTGIESLVMDGPNEVCFGFNTASSLFDPSIANRQPHNYWGLVPFVGGMPLLVPGVNNRWCILQESAQVTNTLAFDVSYWPRWLEVAKP